MLTSDAILTQRFTATKFREGYDVVAVDTFLDEVLVAFRHYEAGGGPGAGLTSAQVRTTTFTATKFREGYDVAQVDDFLDEVIKALVGWESTEPGLRRSVVAAPVATTPASTTPAAVTGAAQAELGSGAGRVSLPTVVLGVLAVGILVALAFVLL